MARHRLRREIVATRVTNDLVDRAGTTFVFRLREDTGASHADIARAYAVAREVFDDARRCGRRSRRSTARSPPTTQIEMLLSGRRMVERATRWLLRTRPRPLDIAAEVERFAAGARAVAGAAAGRAGASPSRRRGASASASWGGGRAGGAGGARGGAGRAVLGVGHRGGRRRRPGAPVEEVAALHFLLGGRLHLHWLRDQIALLARDNRWQAMARAALRDDLFRLHAELTADVLRCESLDAWYEANKRGRRPRAGDPRRDPRGRDVRPHDAAGGVARGAQPDPLRRPSPRVETARQRRQKAPGSGRRGARPGSTHLTQMKPRWSGATSRSGAPWPWVSGSPPTWVASSRSLGLVAVEAPAVAGDARSRGRGCRGGPRRSAVEAGAAPALRRVEAAGAVERGDELVAASRSSAFSARVADLQRVVGERCGVVGHPRGGGKVGAGFDSEPVKRRLRRRPERSLQASSAAAPTPALSEQLPARQVALPRGLLARWNAWVSDGEREPGAEHACR